MRPLSCFSRVGKGSAPVVIGGAVGRTWGAYCELQQLWVAPAHRRRGLDADLVRAFEQRAERRGCHTFHLETFSFQAPSLYRALDYVVKHKLHGFAPGVVNYLMVREVAGSG